MKTKFKKTSFKADVKNAVSNDISHKQKGVAYQDPYEYQDTHQEKVVHSNTWEKGNSYRYVLEGTGDIFRETTKQDYNINKGYISQKITRIKNHINAVEESRDWSEMENEIYTKKYGISPCKTKIHPEDSYEYAYNNNKEKFEQMKQQWQEQPYTTKMQKQAIDLNLAMLDKDYDKAKSIIKNIEGDYDK